MLVFKLFLIYVIMSDLSSSFSGHVTIGMRHILGFMEKFPEFFTFFFRFHLTLVESSLES